MRCIKTGCALRLAHRNDYAWGDLFQLEGTDTLVFNANTRPTLDGASVATMWHSYNKLNNLQLTRQPCITLEIGDDYWERRGVFVFKANVGMMNRHLRDSVGGTWQ